jgi:hypothetical protein
MLFLPQEQARRLLYVAGGFAANVGQRVPPVRDKGVLLANLILKNSVKGVLPKGSERGPLSPHVPFGRCFGVLTGLRNARTWLSALLFDLGNTPPRCTLREEWQNGLKAGSEWSQANRSLVARANPAPMSPNGEHFIQPPCWNQISRLNQADYAIFAVSPLHATTRKPSSSLK